MYSIKKTFFILLTVAFIFSYQQVTLAENDVVKPTSVDPAVNIYGYEDNLLLGSSEIENNYNKYSNEYCDPLSTSDHCQPIPKKDECSDGISAHECGHDPVKPIQVIIKPVEEPIENPIEPVEEPVPIFGGSHGWISSLQVNSNNVVDEVIEEDIKEEKEATEELVNGCQLENGLEYDLYIINPDSTKRQSKTEFVKTETVSNNVINYKFEDHDDFDYNDLIIQAESGNQSKVIFKVISVNASWHHKIGVTFFYKGQIRQDYLMWEDSQVAKLKEMNVDLSYACQLTRSQVDYDLYLVNYMGTERHIKTKYAKTETISPGIILYKFEDRNDFDYNDVSVEVDSRANNKLVVKLLPDFDSKHSWHHQVKINLLNNSGQQLNLTLWESSHTDFELTQVINLE